MKYSMHRRSVNPLLSMTVVDILKGVDPNFIHHREHKAELGHKPFLHKVYGSTLLFGVHSSEFYKNGVIYVVKVLLKDFVVLARDRDISIEEAIQYAIDELDCHIHCTCPAHLYWGYKYVATQIGYQYGFGEKRFPDIRNPNLRGTICKHGDLVLSFILENRKYITQQILKLYGGKGIPLTRADLAKTKKQAKLDADKIKAENPKGEAPPEDLPKDDPGKKVPDAQEPKPDQATEPKSRKDRGSMFDF